MESSKLDCFRLRLRDDGIRNRHRGLDLRSPDKAGDSCFRGNDGTIAGGFLPSRGAGVRMLRVFLALSA
ncbi:MAG: hypothetical protein LBR51_03940 [Bacteroidales bacterium]|jgi:hypothetical protein|nr:hypothetical protein [Bacteroidales bacterium]